MDLPVLLHPPDWVAMLVDNPVTRIAVRVLLTSAYWVSGLTKLFDWQGALAEERSFGLRPPGFFAGLTIAVQLTGSLLVISGVLLWLGAAMLGVFTLAAMVVAYPFWRQTGPERTMTFIAFCEHLGLIAGFVLVTAVSAMPAPGIRP